jgi:hypothetical protein
MENQEWKYIEGYDNYKINKNGDVYKNDVKIEPFMHSTRKTYYVFMINKNNRNCSHQVARLVYESFVGQIKDGTKLVYKDGDIHNYRLSNLEVVNKYQKLTPIKPIQLDHLKNWKPIINYEELYKISDYGDVYSVVSNKLLNPVLSNKGYYRIVLTKDKKKRKFYIHCLVFKTFVKSTIDLQKVIDHIDMNKTNNYVGNLREATLSINAKNIDKKPKYNLDPVIQYTKDMKFVKEWKSPDEIIKQNPTFKKDSISHCCVGRKKTVYGYIWKYKNYAYDQSGYYKIKTGDGRTYSNYKINKEGNIINIKNGRPIKHKKNEYSYVHMTSDCGQRPSFSIHKLVATTFIPNPKNYPIINHIDENKFNNKVDNLEWCDHKHNSKHSLGKKVQQLDKDTEEVLNTFESLTCAFKSLNRKTGHPWNIGRACSGKQETAFGYKWKFV